MKHILITGAKGVGKSTLIRKLLQHLGQPAYGFCSQKEQRNKDGYFPVYIHELSVPRHYTRENLIGLCKENGSQPFPEAFDRFAKKLYGLPKDGILLFDELGLLESNAPEFQKAVLFHLAGEQRVIAAVRNKPSPFLDRVRSLENCAVYRIDAENRNVVLLQILADLDAGRI